MTAPAPDGAALVDYLGNLPPFAQFLGIMFSSFLSEDLTVIAVGILWAKGALDLSFALVATWAGLIIGDLLLYFAGFYWGRRALDLPVIRGMLNEQGLERWEHWFARRGVYVVLASRFLPGTRSPCFLAAGILRMPAPKFAITVTIGVMIQATMLMFLAAKLGYIVFDTLQVAHHNVVNVIVVIVLAYLLMRLLVLLLDTTRRRLLWLDLVRLRSHEFWPFWLFYPPLMAYYAWLAIRHRSLTLPSAVNPGMTAGGMVGDRKSELLSQYGGPPDWVARHLLVEPDPEASAEDRAARALGLMQDAGLGFPVIAKPDVGERGGGVRLIHTPPDITHYCEAMPFTAFLLQEYVPGPLEWGVFYTRHPDEPQGRVDSITLKSWPEVVGDGQRTLAELILNDVRARLMARVFLARHVDNLEVVLAKGERRRLVHAGNHCQGAVFRDGRSLITPALEATIHRLASGFPGLNFARFDIRMTDAGALERGDGFKVLEVNGASAEATHVWDPGYDAWRAWRDIAAIWRRLFSIAEAQRQRGTPITPLRELRRLHREFRAQRHHHPPTD